MAEDDCTSLFAHLFHWQLYDLCLSADVRVWSADHAYPEVNIYEYASCSSFWNSARPCCRSFCKGVIILILSLKLCARSWALLISMRLVPAIPVAGTMVSWWNTLLVL